jgi:hypothetical protein
MRRTSLVSLWTRFRTLNRDPADGTVFAAMNGELGLTSPVRVRLTVTDQRVMIVPLPGQRSTEVLSFAPAEITAVNWSSRRSFSRKTADLRFTLRQREPVWLRLSCPGWSSDLAQMHRTLQLVGPEDDRRPTPRLRLPSIMGNLPTLIMMVIVVGFLVNVVHRSSSESSSSPVSSPDVVSLQSQGPVTGPSPVVTSGPLPSSSDDLPATAGAAPPPFPKGYEPLTGQGQNLELGAPWGRPCVPLHLILGSGLPPEADANLGRVLTELVASVPVIVVVTHGDANTVYGPGPGPGVALKGPVNDVLSFVDLPIDGIGDVTRAPGVQPASWPGIWSTEPSGISGLAVLVHMKAGLQHNIDGVTSRKMLRLIMARSLGIFESRQPGSGLLDTPNASKDGFSAKDLSALRASSGC